MGTIIDSTSSTESCFTALAYAGQQGSDYPEPTVALCKQPRSWHFTSRPFRPVLVPKHKASLTSSRWAFLHGEPVAHCAPTTRSLLDSIDGLSGEHEHSPWSCHKVQHVTTSRLVDMMKTRSARSSTRPRRAGSLGQRVVLDAIEPDLRNIESNLVAAEPERGRTWSCGKSIRVRAAGKDNCRSDQKPHLRGKKNIPRPG